MCDSNICKLLCTRAWLSWGLLRMDAARLLEERCGILSSVYLRIVLLLFFFFFFSSRRRHTRCSRDWSSDVRSSDLAAHAELAEVGEVLAHLRGIQVEAVGHLLRGDGLDAVLLQLKQAARVDGETVNRHLRNLRGKIGRASCRERV